MNRVHEGIAALESEIGNAQTGLPEDIFLFISRVTPLVNVDLLIKDDRDRTLLTWRDDHFYGAGWHVPGGIVRYKERLSERIQAVGREELGADVRFDVGPIGLFESINTEAERGHFISFLYRCELTSAPRPDREARPGVAHRAGQWMWHESCPKDLIRAQEMYRRYVSISR